MTGAEVHGDLCAGRLRIADNVLFEGHCSMVESADDVAIFSLSAEEIKAGLKPHAPAETHEQ
jgi:cytoskeletal protein CcmA (bactofilin family)